MSVVESIMSLFVRQPKHDISRGDHVCLKKDHSTTGFVVETKIDMAKVFWDNGKINAEFLDSLQKINESQRIYCPF